MDYLPDEMVQYILSRIDIGRDVAACNCVSKKWKDLMPYIKRIHFPRTGFDKVTGICNRQDVLCRMVASIVALEELIVHCSFSSASLASWMSHSALSLRHLELRMECFSKNYIHDEECSKMQHIDAARNLETLKLWGVCLTDDPKWNTFHRLRSLQIITARVEDEALSAVLQSCPNLTNLLLLKIDGVRTLQIELPSLQQCKLDFFGFGDSILFLNAPKLVCLEVQGCNFIKVPQTQCLKSLSIANSAGIWISKQSV